MKIISKYKDYYDYLTGIYGIDPLLILDRRDYNENKYFDFEIKKVSLFICDKHIEGLFYKGRFYYGEKIEPFNDVESKTFYYNLLQKTTEKYYVKNDNNTTISINKHIEDCNINTKFKCPILLSKYGITDDIENFYKFPILSKLDVPSILSADFIWLMLSQFLATINEKPITPVSNNIKITSAGFDLITSFRGK